MERSLMTVAGSMKPKEVKSNNTRLERGTLFSGQYYEAYLLKLKNMDGNFNVLKHGSRSLTGGLLGEKVFVKES